MVDPYPLSKCSQHPSSHSKKQKEAPNSVQNALRLGSILLAATALAIPGVIYWASQMAPVVKNPPAYAGDIKRYGFHSWVRKIPWGEGAATHYSILAWRIPWTEEPAGLQFMGSHYYVITHKIAWGTSFLQCSWHKTNLNAAFFTLLGEQVL